MNYLIEDDRVVKEFEIVMEAMKDFFIRNASYIKLREKFDKEEEFIERLESISNDVDRVLEALK